MIRPVVTLSFAINEAITGFIPVGYRLVNLMLHCAVSCLVVLVAAAVGLPLFWAFFAGVLFAVHPIHCEAIAATANRTEPMCALFYLGAILCYLFARRTIHKSSAIGAVVACWCLFALSLGSKEVAITFPAVVFAAELAMRLARVPAYWGGEIPQPYRRDRGDVAAAEQAVGNAAPTVATWFGLGLVLILAGYFVYRAAVLVSPFSANVLPGDNPLVATTGLSRWATPFSQLALAVELLVYPARLSVDYTIAVLPVVQTIWDGSLWAGVVCAGVVVSGFVVAVRRRNIPLFIGICLFCATYALVSNTFILATILFAERVLYLPSAGLCIACAAMVSGIPMYKGRRVAVVVAVAATLAVCALAARSWVRHGDWQTDAQLFASSLEARPNSSRLHTNLGRLSMMQNDWEVAGHHLDTALQLHPENAQALLLRGQLARRMSQNDMAIDYLEKANVALGGKNGRALADLCSIYSELHQRVRAEDVCNRATRLRPDHPDTWTAFGDFARSKGDFRLSESSYRRALELDPANQHALNRLGRLLAETKRYVELLDVMYRIWDQDQGNEALIHDIGALTTKVAASALRAKNVDLAREVLARARQRLGQPDRWDGMLRDLPAP